jgi:hypothetical protein
MSARRVPAFSARLVVVGALAAVAACSPSPSEIGAPSAAAPATPPAEFELLEARIADIHAAIESGTLTAPALVETYLQRMRRSLPQKATAPRGAVASSCTASTEG